MGALLILLAGCASSITAPGNGTATPSGTATVTGTPGTATPTAGPHGPSAWVSVVYDSTAGRQNPLSVANLNPFSGNHTAITAIPISSEGIVDSVSPDGQMVAYHVQNGTASTYFVAHIDTLTAPQTLGVVNNAVGLALWEHDNAHLAVAGSGQVTILSTASQVPTTLSNIHASTLVAFSADNSTLYYVAASDASALGPGALYRVALNNTTQSVELTPREMNSHFVLSPDGQTFYYNNTGGSGQQAIYAASIQGNGNTPSPTLVRSGAGVPVGFSTTGALLYAMAQSAGVALMQLNSSGATDATLVPNLITSGVTIADLGADVLPAPDGSAVVVLATVGTSGFEFFYTPLNPVGTQTHLLVSSVSRVDLIGWDTVIIAVGS
jgi:hypothetical protein